MLLNLKGSAAKAIVDDKKKYIILTNEQYFFFEGKIRLYFQGRYFKTVSICTVQDIEFTFTVLEMLKEIIVDNIKIWDQYYSFFEIPPYIIDSKKHFKGKLLLWHHL